MSMMHYVLQSKDKIELDVRVRSFAETKPRSQKQKHPASTIEARPDLQCEECKTSGMSSSSGFCLHSLSYERANADESGENQTFEDEII